MAEGQHRALDAIACQLQVITRSIGGVLPGHILRVFTCRFALHPIISMGAGAGQVLPCMVALSILTPCSACQLMCTCIDWGS